MGGEIKARCFITQYSFFDCNVNGKVMNKDLQKLFKISAQAVHKELTKLVNLKVIKSVGEGRALHYILV
jgi:predicted HTH transcriptional regulator